MGIHIIIALACMTTIETLTYSIVCYTVHSSICQAMVMHALLIWQWVYKTTEAAHQVAHYSTR